MADDVTIVMVPRDHFSDARRSLESVLAHTSPLPPFVYVDHSAPAATRAWLEQTCRARGIRRIPVERPLTPNEARNLALREVRTRYTVFLDNDAVVTPGWLEPLRETAETRGAWLVGPLYLIGEPALGRVHMKGGRCRFREEDGRRRFEEQHDEPDADLESLRPRLAPAATELVEFHCMLARSDVFQKVGPLDEALLTHAEHVDLCLRVREAGGALWLDPRSVVTYLPPRRLERDELGFYLLRWSEASNRASVERFCEKWRIEDDDPYRAHQRAFLKLMRRRALPRLAWPLGRLLELLVYRPGIGAALEPLVAGLERAATRRLLAARRGAARARPGPRQ